MRILQFLSAITLSELLQMWEHVVFIGSILAILFPPIEWFNSLPRFQIYYRMFIKVLTYYMGLSLRGKVAQLLAGGQPQSGLPDPQSGTRNVVIQMPKEINAPDTTTTR